MTDSAALIRRFRERAKLSQEDLALAVGVSFGAVSQWETGRTHPRRATAVRLDQSLGANGEIIQSLGYALPDEAPAVLDELATLRALVVKQGDELRQLAGVVAQLQQAQGWILEMAREASKQMGATPTGRPAAARRPKRSAQ